MDIPNGASELGIVQGRRTGYLDPGEGLLIRYDARLELIEDQCVIAVVENERFSRATEDYDKVYSVLIVKTDEYTEGKYHFESLEVTHLFDSYIRTYSFVELPPHLQVTQAGNSVSTEIHVVISTRSGTGLAEDFFSKVVQPLLATLGLDGSYQVHKTTSEKTISELAESLFLPQAKSGILQTIVLLSGDGYVCLSI